MAESSFVKDYTESEAEQVLKILNNEENTKKLIEVINSQENLYEQNSTKTNESLNKKDNSQPSQNEEDVYISYSPSDPKLPILSNKDEIIMAVETESVVIIQGPTGCGKSTQIPQFILDSYMKRRQHCNIIVTQPRRIAAISLAKRVDEERQFDHLVGYKVGMLRDLTSDTRLTYCTTEILLNMLIYQKNSFNYTHIVLDEIHERDQHVDFLLLVVKILMEMCVIQVKVVIMSATMNVDKFAEYFSTRVGETSVPARVLRIPEKKRFDIHTYYLNDLISCMNPLPKVTPTNPTVTPVMITLCANIIIALDDIDHNDGRDGDSHQRHTVLIFLPGKSEIAEMQDYLSKYEHKMWDVVILHSTISYIEQQRIFYKPPKDHRRIILATNIAESSITVPDVKYVIDFCMVRVLRVDSATQYQSLQLCWASKVNCMQRAGRAGRVMDGRVYRLIPKNFYSYNVLPDESTPEILRAPLANVVLRAKMLDIGDPRTLLSLALDPPNIADLANTILVLKEVGALANEADSFQPYDGKLTDLGRIMALLPLDIRISKMIVLGHVFGILRDAIVVGASMSIRDIFSNSFRSDVSSYIVRRKWACDSDSDCIAALNIYDEWKREKANRRLPTNQDEKQWAEMNGVQQRSLHELDVLVKEITDRLTNRKIEESTHVNKVIWEGDDRDFVLQVILAGAFYPNYFVKQPRNPEVCKKEIVRTLSGVLSPMNTVYLRGWPYENVGYLYAKRFQKIFSKHLGIPEKQIAVSFDNSTRVCVHYCGKKASAISPHTPSDFVYKAIKMRHCKVPIEVKVLNDKTKEDKLAMRHNIEKFEQKLYFSEHNKSPEDYVPKIRPELPGLDVTFIPLSITMIVSPEYFWASLDDETTFSYASLIDARLNVHSLKELTCHPEKSDIIAAPMTRNKSSRYQRAMVEESLGDGKFSVLFVDHGATAEVLYTRLRKINDPELLNIPCLAFRCRLACLRPSSQANLYGQWSTLSNNYFRTQVEKHARNIHGRVYSVVNSVVNLELIVDAGKRQINLNDNLIEKGFATKTEESYLSKHNHERRMLMMNVQKITMEERRFYEEEQYDRDYLVSQYPDPPNEKDCSNTIYMRGPCSPLEIELIQLTRAGMNKKVSIETNSVNSVLLDVNLDQTRNRLLVAQSVTEAFRVEVLMLRNTTFLPDIPGLASLLALCFAPRIELRCNPRQTHYTGALCGLGPMDSCTDRSMFVDNDMEIEFDVEISIEDMIEINKLRYWMNKAMQISNVTDNELIVNCQNRIKHLLSKLRHRQRKPLEPVVNTYDDMYKWNCADSYHCPQSTPEEKKESCDIYSLHKLVQLYDRDEEEEEVIQNVLELHNLASQDVDTVPHTVSSFCKLCDVQMIGLILLREHLCTKQHQENIAALRIKVD